MRANRPESIEHDRSKLSPGNLKIGDIIFKYFPHIGQATCDEWAVRLNSEFGQTLRLADLFEEAGKTYEGNQNKVIPGKEWGHLRAWCRNGGKEFEHTPGEAPGGVEIFKSAIGRPRFQGLFKEAGKTIDECVETAADDGSVPRDLVSQWQDDLAEYQSELRKAGQDE